MRLESEISRDALIGELRSLSRRELERTLKAFSASEREQLVCLLEPNVPPAAPAFETLAGLSPWLLKALERSESPSASQPGLTAATRAALALALAADAPTQGMTPAPKRPSGPWRLLALAEKRKRRA